MWNDPWRRLLSRPRIAFSAIMALTPELKTLDLNSYFPVWKALGLARGAAVMRAGGSIADVARAAMEVALRVGGSRETAATIAGEAAGAVVVIRGPSLATPLSSLSG